MLSKEKMMEQAKDYLMEINEDFEEVYIVKGSKSDWVKISTKRAIAWVEAGIEELNCMTKEEMLEVLNSWL